MEKITENTAKRLNSIGVEVFMCPNNLSPDYADGTFLNSLGLNDRVRDWNQICIYFKHYNCVSVETGYGIHWYT
jgi:hypothetical protein